MPAKKRMLDRLEVRIDAKTREALTKLEEIYGTDKAQSEIIREAIIEKAKRESRRQAEKP